MKKRILSLILALAMLCALLPQVALPASAETYSGSCGDGLLWIFDTETGLLTIEGSGRMMTAMGYFPWDSYREQITAVNLPDGLTNIGNRAFIDCSGLESIDIPETVTHIEIGAFSGCTKLKSVSLHDGITEIDGYAFSHCSVLNSINFPESLKLISYKAFLDCEALTSVTLPKNLEGISYNAFGYYDTGEIEYGKYPNFTIYGYNGTVAQEYAEMCGFSFISLDNAVGGFVDVTPSDYFADPVLWAINHEPAITAGVGVHSFGPHNDCTREQIVTFLWAANGKPAPTGTDSTFSDVPADAWYYKPVMWAVENEITKGMEDGSFGVGQPCTRAQAMTFLWAAKGKPAPSSMESPFSDVTAGDWFCKAILWAAENGITKGIGDGLFGVNNTCTLAQIITFLYKAYN